MRPAQIHKYTNTGTAKVHKQTQQQQCEVSVSADSTPYSSTASVQHVSVLQCNNNEANEGTKGAEKEASSGEDWIPGGNECAVCDTITTTTTTIIIIIKFTLEQATEAHKRSRGIILLFL